MRDIFKYLVHGGGGGGEMYQVMAAPKPKENVMLGSLKL